MTDKTKGIATASLNPAQITEAVEHLIALQRPGFIWGPPGIGKSELIAGIAAKHGMELRDERLGTMDPTEVKGFPIPDVANEQMRWLPPDFLPPMMIEKEVTVYRDKAGVELFAVQDEDTVGFVYEDGRPHKAKFTPTETIEVQKVPNDTRGILFLDELNQAPPMTQAAGYQLLLNRRIGRYKLPDGWAMMAAGNRESDRSNAQRMPAALALRLVHLDMLPDVDSWSAWALNHPDEVPVELLAFMRFKSNLLHAFDPARRVSPNPRSWVFAGQIGETSMSPEVKLATIQGAVGAAEGSEYVAYLGMWQELPTVDQVKLDPDGTKIPENISACFGIISALARANTKDVYPRLKKYVDRMDGEWQVLFHKDALAYNRDFCATREFQQFAVANAGLLA